MNGFTDEQWVRYQAEHAAAATEMLYRRVRDKAAEVHNERFREMRTVGAIIDHAVNGGSEDREFWQRLGERRP